MSIVTKGGDSGTTQLMFGRRVSKCHVRVEAGGAVDELNAALGVARAGVDSPKVRDQILAVQKDLILFMGELATLREDLPRLSAQGFATVTPELTARLDRWVEELERQDVAPKG